MLKLALCTIVKNENLYIKEWVDYHLAFFDKIFIYDNNDIDGELLSDVISSDRVEIIDVRGVKTINNSTIQPYSYTDCYSRFGKYFDYMLFMDADCFLRKEESDERSISDILSDNKFEDFDQIRLFMKIATDNNLITANGNYNLQERFTEFKPFNRGYSILKTCVDTVIRVGPHGSDSNFVKSCNILGEQLDWKNFNSFSIIGKTPIYSTLWIDHYITKSLEEYIIQKIPRGYADGSFEFPNLNRYFRTNEMTQEKLDFILENYPNLYQTLDLSKFNIDKNGQA